ncbi:hypothetical protein CEXT_258621 [Caerostris extrusa]|uniref:Uncharacterized protein n=1 Tax=Caerostris extrusa TaxID=172846 RepID=A0AAV4M4J2_CAEEX|nr:hypothetical protein CEXT_258621 [Caerostris extrusa]
MLKKKKKKPTDANIEREKSVAIASEWECESTKALPEIPGTILGKHFLLTCLAFCKYFSFFETHAEWNGGKRMR